ncbi:MAG: AsmA-like C-terminal domain-containing protein [Burkholderiales bacterium]
MALKRRYRWILAAFLSPALLSVALLLTAPLWVNQSTVKREIEKVVASATGGRVQYDRIDLHFLPMPGAELTRLRFSLTGTVEVEAQSASIDIHFLPLLRGDVYPHRVRIVSPLVRIQIEEPQPGLPPQSSTQPQPRPFSLKETEACVREVLAQIQASVPGVNADIEAGQAELRIGQRPPLLAERIDAHLDVTGNTISAKVSGSSNLFTQFVADLRLTTDDLIGEGRVALSGLQVPRLGPLLGMQDGWPVQEAVVNASLKWKMHGLGNAKAEVSVDAPKVALQFGKEGHLDLVGPAIEVAAQTKGESAEVTVRQVAIESPRIALNARFVKKEAGGYALESETSEVDLLALQSVGEALAPAVDWLVDFPVRISRGTLTSVKFATQAARLEELFDLSALHVTGAVENVDLSLPVFYDLKVRQVSALASLHQGVVQVRQVRARLDKSAARDGSFDMDLSRDALPMHVDVTVDADLAEGFAIARRVLPDRQTQQQLNQIKRLEGKAVARVTVGGEVNNVVPRVDVTTLSASLRHDLVPFPIRIARGALTYTTPALSVQGVDGAIGESTFTGVSARLGMNAPYVLSAQQGSAVAALGQLFHWAAAQPRFAKPLAGVKQISGTLALSVAQLEVPLNVPEKMRFRIAATPQRVSVDAPKYGPLAQIDGGVVEVSQQSVNVKSVKASMLDAAIEISGRTDNYRKSVDKVQVSATGTVGLDALAWIYGKAGLSKALRLRAGLNVSGSSVEWRANGAVSARGNVNVVGGPNIGFAVRSLPKRIEIEQVTLRDDASELTVGGRLEGEHFRIAYKGRLAGSSIDRIFVEPLVSIGELQGDFRAEGDFKRPDATTATGRLQGSMIRLPPVLPMPVTIEKLSLEARNTLLLVKSATVSSWESRVDVSGSVTHTKDKFAVDADVRGEKWVVELAPENPANPEAPADPKPAAQSSSILGNPEKMQAFLHSLWALPVTGTVRVDIGLLRIGGMQISPLVASVLVAAPRLDIRIGRAALCAIALSGEVTTTEENAEATIRLSARGAQVTESITCLTDQRLQITGKFDLDGDFSASGKPGTLLNVMQGKFTAVATDGRIDKFDALAEVFKLINVTQILVGKAPDLGQSGMKYYSAKVMGILNGRQMRLSEASLDASGFKVVAQGKVEYDTGQIDFDVLFAPFQTVNTVMNYIPILRRIFGGTVLAVPVGVRGTLEKPVVIPLGLKAMGSRLVDLLGNTLKVPGDIIKVTPVAPTETATPPQTSPSQR